MLQKMVVEKVAYYSNITSVQNYVKRADIILECSLIYKQILLSLDKTDRGQAL